MILHSMIKKHIKNFLKIILAIGILKIKVSVYKTKIDNLDKKYIIDC